MIDKILNFVQTNIIHFGYWIAMLIFGSVIKSIVKTLKEEKSTLSKIKEKLKDRFKKTGEPQIATKKEIDSMFPKEEER